MPTKAGGGGGRGEDAARAQQGTIQLHQEKISRAKHTTVFNIVSTSKVNTCSSASSELLVMWTQSSGPSSVPFDLETLNTPYADQSVGAEVDFNNMEPSTVVSHIPTTRVYSIHHKAQIIGDPKSAVQTTGKTKKILESMLKLATI
ncbi:hypothetical protein Tco_0121284 [Tanacetum coccineum]